MIHIAICDDQATDLNHITTLTREYAKTNGLIIELQEFHHPDELLQISKTKLFDIYILDIVMPMVDGIKVGQELRRYSRSAHIIYATSDSAFALDAYAVNPSNYLLKPVKSELFFSTMDLILSHMELQPDQSITVKDSAGYQTLYAREIVQCEYVKHSIRYILRNGKVVQSSTFRGDFLSQLTVLLESGRFIQVHAAYIVEIAAIIRLSRTNLELFNGNVIPVARGRYDIVKKAYLAYRLGGTSHA